MEMSPNTPLLSIIVPTLNDDENLKKNVEKFQKDLRFDVIVVDAKKLGRANRAYQMNMGAKLAKTELLLFLHADTSIEISDAIELTSIMKKEKQFVGGAFRFKFDINNRRTRFLEFGAKLRQKTFSLPYGDQALFVRPNIFVKLGGYPDVPILEDVLFSQKLNKAGKLFFFERDAVTSARAYDTNGYFFMWFVNLLTIILWKFRIPLEKIQSVRRRLLRCRSQ